VARNTPFGNSIENIVDKFYNLYSSQDDGLEVNKFYEQHDPLGLVGAPNFPRNYVDTNVTNEIIPLSDADGDGNLEECFEEFNSILYKFALVPDRELRLGDNHCGYIGFRQQFSDSLIDDGVMDTVVSDWAKP
jgi:hypothetical protein